MIQDPENIPNLFTIILPSIISFIGVIFGVIVGSILSLRIQNIQWLRKHRAETFSDFLNTLHKCKENVFDHAKSYKKIDLGQYLKLYTPVNIKSKSVLLILRDKDKKPFEGFINKIISNHTFWSKHYEKDYKKVYDLFTNGLNEIQKILESNLKSNKW